MRLKQIESLISIGKMNYKINGTTVLLTLEPNELINKTIQNIFVNEKLNFGWISGLGAVKNIELGYYDLESKTYIKKIFKDDYELLSLTGNVTLVKGDYFVHSHVVISDKKFNCFGGHLFDAIISAAGEFKITLENTKITRKFSKEIGLNLWCDIK